MNTRLEVQFEEITPENERDLRLAALALALTNDRESVRVFPKPERPGWLVAEFTMARGRQIDAVNRIDRSMHFEMLDRLDSVISFL